MAATARKEPTPQPQPVQKKPQQPYQSEVKFSFDRQVDNSGAPVKKDQDSVQKMLQRLQGNVEQTKQASAMNAATEATRRPIPGLQLPTVRPTPTQATLAAFS